MSNVVRLEPFSGTPEKGLVHFDDGSQAWSPALDKLTVGKPVPDKWTWKDGPKGKQLLPPKEQGKAAYANTEEGLKYEQERMDRRTALMQAIGSAGEGGLMFNPGSDSFAWEFAAERMYQWLRKTSSGSTATLPVDKRVETATASADSAPRSKSPAAPSGEGGGNAGKAPAPYGEGGAGACQHINASGEKADGTPLPGDFMRCLECGQISDKTGAFK